MRVAADTHRIPVVQIWQINFSIVIDKHWHLDLHVGCWLNIGQRRVVWMRVHQPNTYRNVIRIVCQNEWKLKKMRSVAMAFALKTYSCRQLEWFRWYSIAPYCCHRWTLKSRTWTWVDCRRAVADSRQKHTEIFQFECQSAILLQYIDHIFFRRPNVTILKTELIFYFLTIEFVGVDPIEHQSKVAGIKLVDRAPLQMVFAFVEMLFIASSPVIVEITKKTSRIATNTKISFSSYPSKSFGQLSVVSNHFDVLRVSNKFFTRKNSDLLR